MKYLLAVAALAFGAFLFLPSRVQAQQSGSGPASTPAPTPAPKLSPADSVACTQVIGYVFQNPDVMKKGQELQGEAKAKVIIAQPDSVRASIAEAIAKGQGDQLKTMARQLLDTTTAPTFDKFIDFVVAFPDSVRNAVATLVKSGRTMTCS